jgi:hypothetical protein
LDRFVPLALLARLPELAPLARFALLPCREEEAGAPPTPALPVVSVLTAPKWEKMSLWESRYFSLRRSATK